MAEILQIKSWQEAKIEYALRNGGILLFADEKALRNNSGLKKDL